jgi:hypothetical protein
VSIQNHPNIHAVKLMLAVNDIAKSCLRGPAEKKVKDIEFTLLNESRKFAIHLSEVPDEIMEGYDDPIPPTRSQQNEKTLRSRSRR